MTLAYGYVKAKVVSEPKLKPSRHLDEIQYHLHFSMLVDGKNWDVAVNVGTNDADDLLKYKLVFDFRHPVGPCLTFDPDAPYQGLACRPQWLFGILARYGFVVETVRPGNWRQVRSYEVSQDYLVARRPPDGAAPPPDIGSRSAQS